MTPPLSDIRRGAKVRVFEHDKKHGLACVKTGIAVQVTTHGCRVMDPRQGGDGHPEFAEWFPYESPDGKLFVREAGANENFGPGQSETRFGVRVDEVKREERRRRTHGSGTRRGHSFGRGR